MRERREMYLVDVDFLRFLERHVSGLTRRDVLATLARTPARAWKVEELAREVGRPTAAVAYYLEDLAREGLVVAYRTNGHTRYMLSPDPRIRAMVRRLWSRGSALTLVPRFFPPTGAA